MTHRLPHRAGCSDTQSQGFLICACHPSSEAYSQRRILSLLLLLLLPPPPLLPLLLLVLLLPPPLSFDAA